MVTEPKSNREFDSATRAIARHLPGKTGTCTHFDRVETARTITITLTSWPN